MKRDLRIERTYKSLIDALKQLMTEKRFEEITVSELCNRAMVRRATFYKHFGDKYELYTFLIRELQQQFLDNISPEIIDNSNQLFLSLMSQTLDFLEKNMAMVKTIFSSSVAHVLINILQEQIELDIRLRLKEKQKNGDVVPYNPELLAVQISAAMVYTAKWWIQNHEKVSKEEVIKDCAVIFDRL